MATAAKQPNTATTAEQKPASPSSPRTGGWTATKATPDAWTAPSQKPATSATSYQLEYEQEDVTGTTKGMLNLVKQTNDVADHTLRELDSQNEKLKNQQDEVAEIHDDLNVAGRKIRSIKSFWGGLGNFFSKDKGHEHRNARQKYEKDMAKDKLKGAETLQKEEDATMKERVVVHQQNLKTYVDEQNPTMQQAKDQSKAQVKSGNTDGGMVGGKFVFAERKDNIEMCEAERDLEEIGEYTNQLKQKAFVMGGAINETTSRVENLNEEMERANERTKAANRKQDKILKS